MAQQTQMAQSRLEGIHRDHEPTRNAVAETDQLRKARAFSADTGGITRSLTERLCVTRLVHRRTFKQTATRGQKRAGYAPIPYQRSSRSALLFLAPPGRRSIHRAAGDERAPRAALEWRILRRAPWPELALAVLALLLSGLGAEAYLRRFHPVDATIYRLHARYLHALIPGARKLFVHRPENDGKVLVSVNSSGFRGPELAPEKRGLRVLVYGDSFVAAEFSSVERSFVARLGARLADALGVPVEAVNAGVTGYGPDQEALRIEDEIVPLAPDLIVVGLFAGNDFGDLMRNKLFRLDSDGRLLDNAWTLAPSLEREFARAERLLHESMLLRGLDGLLAPSTRRSTLHGRLLPDGGFPLLREKRQREYLEYVRDGDNEVRHVLGDPYDADLSLAPGCDSARYKQALMERVLLRIAATGRAQNVPVVFVFIPSAFDVCDAWEERVDPTTFPDYRRDALTSALARIAERNGLSYLDLYPQFRTAGADSLYYRRDEHWNDAGQALAANLTSALVISMGWPRKP